MWTGHQKLRNTATSSHSNVVVMFTYLPTNLKRAEQYITVRSARSILFTTRRAHAKSMVQRRAHSICCKYIIYSSMSVGRKAPAVDALIPIIDMIGGAKGAERRSR